MHGTSVTNFSKNSGLSNWWKCSGWRGWVEWGRYYLVNIQWICCGTLTAPLLVGPWHIASHRTELRHSLVLASQSMASPLSLSTSSIPVSLGSLKPDFSSSESGHNKGGSVKFLQMKSKLTDWDLYAPPAPHCISTLILTLVCRYVQGTKPEGQGIVDVQVWVLWDREEFWGKGEFIGAI